MHFEVGARVRVVRTSFLLADQYQYVGHVFTVRRIAPLDTGSWLITLDIPEVGSAIFLDYELEPALSEELIDDYRAEVRGG